LRFWGQLGIQNGINTIIECIIYFHDYIIILLISILIFVVYIFLFIIFLPNLDKVSLNSHRLEIIWTVSPIFLLLFIAYPSLVLLYYIESIENSNSNINLKVVGHQWYWEYEIKDTAFEDNLKLSPTNFYTLETISCLDLPFKKIISLYVTSQDVLHSWTIPRLGIKSDAVPGRINTLYFSTSILGIFYGQCREICGSSHSFIPICCKVY